jgi:hypothetical protein
MDKYILVHGIKIARDFVPETFGRLTTIGPRFLMSQGTQGKHKVYQACQCSCGNSDVLVIRVDSLKRGDTTSCGCYLVEKVRAASFTHGLSRTREYNIWANILDRCNNPNCEGYAKYGKVGIKACDRWQEPNGQGFLNFWEDMGPRPGPGYSVDRYPDKFGNYEPNNCRWATQTEQMRNVRSNKLLTSNGKTQCITEWAEELNIPHYIIRNRIKAKWDVDTALYTPVAKRKPRNEQ